MELAYKNGGINTSSWFFNGMPNVIYKTAVKGLESHGVYWPGMGFVGIGAAAMLSRALAGVAHGKLLFALPGSETACRLALEQLILPELGHLVGELRKG